MRRTGSARKRSSSKGQSRADKRGAIAAAGQFAICVRNDDYPASLELRKLYAVLPDDFADQHNLIRVVDESGEDYLYPDDYFLRIDLPRAVEEVLGRIA